VSSFKIRATPAHLGAIGRVSDQAELALLQRRAALLPPLLYLGQANGVIVLYDSRAQQAVYVPSSSVVLRLSNCERPAAELVCRQAVD
jgi:hypothetical protein